jgi:zinc transport system permease protein
VALGILVATWGGGSFTKFNSYLIGDILSVTPMEIGLLALVLLGVVLLWCFGSNRLFLSVLHPNLADSRGVQVGITQGVFTVAIAVVVTLALNWVGLLVINSLLVLPAAAARNFAKNLRQYHLFSVLGALVCGILGLMTSYYWGCSTGAAVSLLLAVYFFVGFLVRRTA